MLNIKYLQQLSLLVITVFASTNLLATEAPEFDQYPDSAYSRHRDGLHVPGLHSSTPIGIGFGAHQIAEDGAMHEATIYASHFNDGSDNGAIVAYFAEDAARKRHLFVSHCRLTDMIAQIKAVNFITRLSRDSHITRKNLAVVLPGIWKDDDDNLTADIKYGEEGLALLRQISDAAKTEPVLSLYSGERIASEKRDDFRATLSGTKAEWVSRSDGYVVHTALD